MINFRPYEPDQQLLLPPSLRDWIPPDHLVWFISETVDQLDLSEILDGYRDGGQGNLPYHPAMMLKILIYAYATGILTADRPPYRGEHRLPSLGGGQWAGPSDDLPLSRAASGRLRTPVRASGPDRW